MKFVPKCIGKDASVSPVFIALARYYFVRFRALLRPSAHRMKSIDFKRSNPLFGEKASIQIQVARINLNSMHKNYWRQHDSAIAYKYPMVNHLQLHVFSLNRSQMVKRGIHRRFWRIEEKSSPYNISRGVQ